MSTDPKNGPTLSAVKQALSVRRLRSEVVESGILRAEPIAVVGMGCRFPGGADSPDDYWRLLDAGVDAIREVPPDRWDVDRFYDPDPGKPGKMSTRWGGFLNEVDRFDHAFFGIAPREASTMDPQQRLMLEVSWEALNDAGIPPESLGGSDTGVFLAIYNSDYARLQLVDVEGVNAHTGSGTSHGVAPGRLSYLLDLRGPSLAVDTACSSSLVAIHLACQSLRDNECRLALAGGVSLLLTPEETVSLSKWGMLAPDGRCKTFDAGANGFVRGEGCGVVVLKRLSDALSDGDPIHAVVRGTAVNQDGRSSALTAPNGLSQQEVIRRALENARVSADEVTYVEAHGTGTAVGDPIEVEALAEVLGRRRPDRAGCVLGSVKTNFGHLEAAAGVAGVIKVVLGMLHERIPPHLHFKKLNPLISLEGTCLSIASEARAWPRSERPRFAGVSSFGFGGTNAHVVLEEAPRTPTAPGSDGPGDDRARLLPISARSFAALREMEGRFAPFLEEEGAGSPGLDDICHTAARRRFHDRFRAAFVGRSRAEIAASIRARLERTPASSDEPSPVLASGPRIAFVFSGQGRQWPGMGRRLLETEKRFRRNLERCDELFRPRAGWSLLEELASDEKASRLHRTEVLQPLLFALQVALVELWRSWGVTPHAVTGHSVGEIAAAHVAGALKLEEALEIVRLRGRLMQRAAGRGAMAAVGLTEEEAVEAVASHAGRLCVAAVNAPSSATLSGDPEPLEELLGSLKERGVFARRLEVDCAFHSPHMDEARSELVRALSDLKPGNGSVSFVSAVVGRELPGGELGADYWGRNIREPVRFAAAIDSLAGAGIDAFLEVGPDPILATPMQQCIEHAGSEASVLASLRRGGDERASMLGALGNLYELGHSPNWEAFEPDARCVSLPAYPWQKERSWVKPGPPKRREAKGPSEEGAHPLLGRMIRSPFARGRIHEATLAPDRPAYLDDHRLCGVAAVPATAMIEGALAAGQEALAVRDAGQEEGRIGDADLGLEQLTIDAALVLADDEDRLVQWGVEATEGSALTVRLFSESENDGTASREWVRHATATVRPIPRNESRDPDAPREPLERIRERCASEIGLGGHFESLSRCGVELGPAFRGLEALWSGEGEALGRVRVPGELLPDLGAYRLHPSVLDACLQALAPALHASRDPAEPPRALIPVALERFLPLAPAADSLWSHARARGEPGADSATSVGDVTIYDSDGRVVAEIVGLRLRAVDPVSLRRLVRPDEEAWLYEPAWVRLSPPEVRGSAAVRERRHWLFLADGEGVGEALAERAKRSGDEATLAYPGDRFERAGESRYRLNPTRQEDFRLLLDDMGREGSPPCDGIVHLWSLGLPALPDTEDAPPACTAQAISCGAALHLVQAAAGLDLDRPPGVWLVTRGARRIAEEERTILPQHAPLWGLGAVISVEHPGLRCRRIDLEPGAEPGESASRLWDELVRGEDREDRIALRGEARFAERLLPLKTPADRRAGARAEDRPVELRGAESGVLDDLALVPSARRRPRVGEVEIRVESAGLNFRDLLGALNMIEGPSLPLGGECAGRVVSVGEDVRDLRPEDEVIAFAPGGLRSFVTLPAAFVTRKPRGLSMEQAATAPVAFLTAHYALAELAHLAAGERVLIHAAAGGVGMAAVQLARRAGAEIVGTAGSREKRDLLRGLGLSVVADSRSPGFAEEILGKTGGEGVDVVLNSLSGEFIPRSLALLRAGGRFIELGKRDVWDAERVARERGDVSFHAFDLADVGREEPARLRRMLDELVLHLESGALAPLPLRVFPIDRAADGFRFMAQARHVGKIAFAFGDADRLPAAGPTVPVRAEAAYVITGGGGALGLGLAGWLVDRGARRIALLGRHEPSGGALRIIEALRRRGAEIEFRCADVSDRSRTSRVLREIRDRWGPIAGIAHAAGVLDDGLLVHQSWERFANVMAPKIDGAWNLHRLTGDDALDWFVSYSSSSAILGWPGQGGYAAANAFLDGLAHARRAVGRVALSVDWGPWAESGMAAEVAEAHRRRREAQGIGTIAADEGCDTLGRLLRSAPAQVVALPIDWARYLEHHPSDAEPAFFSEVARRVARPGEGKRAEQAAAGLVERLEQAPASARLELLAEAIEERAARALGLEPGRRIDARRPLHELGLDSLMAVELRNALGDAVGRKLSATLLFDYPTVESLAAHLAREVLHLDLDEAEERREASGPRSRAAEVERLEQLSDADAEALLLNELARGGKDDGDERVR